MIDQLIEELRALDPGIVANKCDGNLHVVSGKHTYSVSPNDLSGPDAPKRMAKTIVGMLGLDAYIAASRQ